MSRQVKVYFDQATLAQFKCGYADEESAARFAKLMGNKSPIIESAVFDLPEGAFWAGDTIAIELRRNIAHDDDGILSGGNWVEVVGLADASMVSLKDGKITGVSGCVRELGTDEHLQNIELRAGHESHVYRNARLIRARTALESGAL